MKIVKVTKDDLKRGKRAHGNACAVARALKRTYGTAEVAVGTVGSLWINDNKYIVSKSLSKLIRKFDSGSKLEPFSIILTNTGKALLSRNK